MRIASVLLRKVDSVHPVLDLRVGQYVEVAAAQRAELPDIRLDWDRDVRVRSGIAQPCRRKRDLPDAAQLLRLLIVTIERYRVRVLLDVAAAARRVVAFPSEDKGIALAAMDLGRARRDGFRRGDDLAVPVHHPHGLAADV